MVNLLCFRFFDLYIWWGKVFPVQSKRKLKFKNLAEISERSCKRANRGLARASSSWTAIVLSWMVRCRLGRAIRMWPSYVTPCYVRHLQLYCSRPPQWLWYHRQCWCRFRWHRPGSLVSVCRCLSHGNCMYDAASRFLWCLARSHQCFRCPGNIDVEFRR